MELNIGILSYSVTALSFFVLSILLITRWRGRLNGIIFLLFNFSVVVWALSAAYSSQLDFAITQVTVSLELLRNIIWAAFLIGLLGILRKDEDRSPLYTLVTRIAWVVPTIMLLATLYMGFSQHPVPLIGFDLRIFSHVVTAIVGLSLIEQVFRGAGHEQRWALKFLCFGMGAMYAFDFYLYSDALLFKRMDMALWEARGFVYSVAMVMIAIAVSRNPASDSKVSVSRGAVFYTTGIVFTGLYLLIMSAGGFYLQAFGGEWGQVVAIAFVFSGILFLLVLFFSGHMRARVRVFIDKHFLDYKYDYREQWLGLIRELSNVGGSIGGSDSLESKALHAILEMMDSPGGSLWVRQNQHTFLPAAKIGTVELVTEPVKTDSSLASFLENWQWVINLDEYANEPALYDELLLPEWLKTNGQIWLIVPLMLQSRLYGFVLIDHARGPKQFNWEDIDLLKTAGRQVAIHLAQNRSALALVQARQFEAFNRFSAFVVHDLKNLVSQLALVVKNAEKHKHNPAFMDDAISTVDNAVERMNRMLAQLRSGEVVSELSDKIDIGQVLTVVIKEKSNARPKPELKGPLTKIYVRGNEERLTSVIGHLVQNAQDATPASGYVSLSLHQSENNAVISIEDNGAGMDQAFIDERLFKPFDTTKGLTGMGIGAHESRAFIEELGGDIEVESTPQQGAKFIITLPLYTEISQGD